MTRNLELIQGLIHTKRCSVQVNTVQDWSLGQLSCSELGHSVGCAGWHCVMPMQGWTGAGDILVPKFTPILAFSADTQKTKSGRICR